MKKRRGKTVRKSKRGLQIGDELVLPVDAMMLSTVVYGARGSGKTTLGRVIAEEVFRLGHRFCAIDLKGDWWGLKSSASGIRKGIPVVVFGGDHGDLPLDESTGQEVARIVSELKQSCVLDFEYLSKGRQLRFQAEFFATLYNVNRKPLVLLMDEAQRYTPQKPFDPEAAKCLGAVEDLVKLGRKHGLAPILFTQRGSGLNKEVSELCDMMVAFRTPGPLDQGRVEDWLEANASREEAKEVLGSLAKLPTGTAIFASGHPDLQVFGQYRVRRPTTFDSSATPKIGQRQVSPRRIAKADIRHLQQRMSAIIERVKATDPKELQKRIADLEKELRGRPETTEVAAPKVVAAKTVLQVEEVPVFDEKSFNKVIEDTTEAVAASEKTIQKARADVSKTVKQILISYRDVQRQAARRKKLPRKALVVPPRALAKAAQSTAAKAAVPPSNGRAPVQRPDVIGSGTVLSKCARGLLAALDKPRSLNEACVIAGYKMNGNAYNAASELRANGFVDGGNERMVRNANGNNLAKFEPPATGQELVAQWMWRIGPCEKVILAKALDAYPHPISLEEAIAGTHYQLNGNVYNAASRIRGLSLVTGKNKELVANQLLVE